MQRQEKDHNPEAVKLIQAAGKISGKDQFSFGKGKGHGKHPAFIAGVRLFQSNRNDGGLGRKIEKDDGQRTETVFSQQHQKHKEKKYIRYYISEKRTADLSNNIPIN